MNPELQRKVRPMAWRVAVMAWVLIAMAPLQAWARDTFLDPVVAFPLSVRALDDKQIELRFGVAPGYHLYRDKFAVSATPADTALGELQIPAGKVEFDPTFQKDVELFREPVVLVLPLREPASSAFKLVVVNQGCTEGLCYPPTERAFKADPTSGTWVLTALTEAQAAAWGPTGAVAAVAAAPLAAAPTAKALAPDEPGQFAAALESRNLLRVAGVFLIAGLLLSFTPCVLPMLPILSSIIVGQRGKVSRMRGYSLALAYSLGMALVYTAFGMAAGLAGEGLAAALQNAWVLGAFALLLVVLSLSMFGVYELQLPSRVQSRITEFSGSLRGGQHVGVFVMGGASALIVGPCVAAPLAGALVYISQTRDVALGGVALFAMAAGMSVPLLLVGLSAGSLLPRSGGWMERVKHFFGVMLLAVALWMVSPVLPAWGLMLGAAALLLVTAVYLGAFERLPDVVTPRRALTKGVGLILAVAATLQLVGLASGGRDLLQPLQQLGAAGPNGMAVARGSQALPFRTVSSLETLDAAVRASTKPVMLDFYADWCVACKEMEMFTFSNDAVRQRLAGMTLLRVDVTANNADDKALMRKYKLFGPPALLFFQPAGAEIERARIIGFMNADAFRDHLDRLQAIDGVKVSLR